MAKLKLSSTQILAGIRYLNTNQGREEYNVMGRYEFEDMFENMGIEVQTLPPVTEFDDGVIPMKENEMSTGFAENLFANINKVE